MKSQVMGVTNDVYFATTLRQKRRPIYMPPRMTEVLLNHDRSVSVRFCVFQDKFL